MKIKNVLKKGDIIIKIYDDNRNYVVGELSERKRESGGEWIIPIISNRRWISEWMNINDSEELFISDRNTMFLHDKGEIIPLNMDKEDLMNLREEELENLVMAYSI